MPATVRPCDGYLVVKLVRPSAMGPSGLIAANLDNVPSWGRVVAVGNGREFATGLGLIRETMPFKSDDVIKFTEFALVHPEGKAGPEYAVVAVQNVICTVDDFVEHDEPGSRLMETMRQAESANKNNGPGLLVPAHVAGQARRRS